MTDYTNKINSFKDIEEIIVSTNKNIYIYGGGLYAFYFYNSLPKQLQEKIKSFVVSCKKNDRYSNPDTICGKSLIEISEVSDKKTLFIIANEEKNHKPIIKTINKKQ